LASGFSSRCEEVDPACAAFGRGGSMGAADEAGMARRGGGEFWLAAPRGKA
jgi:hypothetical protein